MTAIKPALTAEEWASFRALPAIDYTNHPEELERAHRAAAKHLHGQPFGFTREDVTTLRESADYQAIREGNTIGPGSLAAFYTNLADRIEALLPPEEE